MDRPSVQRAAACGLISLPWTRLPLSLGLGFDSQVTDSATDPFQWSDSAFDSTQVHSNKIVYHRFDNCRGTYVSATTTRSTSSSEHLSLSLGVSVGNDLLGASVTGSYDKSVLDNKALSKTSRRAGFNTGTIHFLEHPALSNEAQTLLSSSPHGFDAFRKRYGDYYISAFSIGADAGILITQSSSAHASKEQAKVEAEVQVLCWSDSETVMEKDVNEATLETQFGVTAFDTLYDSFVNISLDVDQGLSFAEARTLATDYSKRVDKLPDRTRSILERWPQLSNTQGILSGAELESLMHSNLISRIVLVPFATHRDVRGYLSS